MIWIVLGIALVLWLLLLWDMQRADDRRIDESESEMKCWMDEPPVTILRVRPSLDDAAPETPPAQSSRQSRSRRSCLSWCRSSRRGRTQDKSTAHPLVYNR